MIMLEKQREMARCCRVVHSYRKPSPTMNKDILCFTAGMDLILFYFIFWKRRDLGLRCPVGRNAGRKKIVWREFGWGRRNGQ